MQKVNIIGVCLALSLWTVGCGHGWKHATLPEKKWDADYADCVYRAESKSSYSRMNKEAAREWGSDGGVRYLIDKCMEAKGYYPADD